MKTATYIVVVPKQCRVNAECIPSPLYYYRELQLGLVWNDINDYHHRNVSINVANYIWLIIAASVYLDINYKGRSFVNLNYSS